MSLPRVFGIGMSRTGGGGLASALQLLGYKNVVIHDKSLNPFLLKDERTFNFTGRYDAADAAVDIPTALYFAELLQEYPDAKFILTIRDKQDWYRASKAHMSQLKTHYKGAIPFRVKALLTRAYGTIDDHKTTWLEKYNKHNTEVRKVIPEAQLLVMDIAAGDGWLQLCGFLGRRDGPCNDSSTVSFPRDIHTPGDHVAPYHTLFESMPDTPLSLACQTAEDGAGTERYIGVKPWKPTSHAYVTLLSEPSDPGRRGYFMDALVSMQSIRDTGLASAL
jgi:hypothetical protein